MLFLKKKCFKFFKENYLVKFFVLIGISIYFFVWYFFFKENNFNFENKLFY